MNIDGIEVRARMVPDTHGKTALEDIDVFGYVQDMLPNKAADMLGVVCGKRGGHSQICQCFQVKWRATRKFTLHSLD
jgi:hypothetical protein